MNPYSVETSIKQMQTVTKIYCIWLISIVENLY